MAGIGGVCVQFSLLEHLTLGLIAAIEGQDLDKTYLVFGSLDAKPRLDMAILLARHIKAPVEYVKIIENVRKALRDERLTERRNQAVHGVHKDADTPDAVQLTMPRWSGARRTETVTAKDLAFLAIRLQELQRDITTATHEIFEWKMRVSENRLNHIKCEAAIADTPIVIKIAKNFYSRAQRFWRKK